jgi:hypothetical protein
VALLLAAAAPAAAGVAEDAYLVGYATAVLERQLEIRASRITARDGVVTIETPKLATSVRERIVAALSSLPGVLRIEVVESPSPPAAAPAGAPRAPTTAPTPGGPAIQAEAAPAGVEFLPRGALFAPLIADPRWPHFSISYQRVPDDPQLRNVGAVSLGETFSLLRGPAPLAGAWELGLQAGVFSIFDVDAASFDLVNADYMVALPLSYRRGDLSVLARVLHQSSHLGDEFLLRNRVERVNLSFEAVDLRLSYDVASWLRVYAGGAYLFRYDPEDLAPWSSQYGVEVRSPWTLFGGAVRPVAGLDVQQREQNDWSADVSLRAGVQFESLPILNRKLQLLFEYFDGHSPNGQFYRDRIQYFGIGLHLYLF